MLAPFAWDRIDPHWYCWDVDRCTSARIVAAGVFASPDEALAEWQRVVGTAGEGAGLVPCGPGLVGDLLRPAVERGPFAAMLGSEPRDFIIEQFRMGQRAVALLDGSVPEPGSRPDLRSIVDDFASWWAGRGGEPLDLDAIGTLADNWSLTSETDYHACSPHRIEHTVVLVTDGYYPEHARASLDLLPAWVDWCIERTGLTGDQAERSRSAARDNQWDGTDTQEFRRAERPGPDQGE